MLACSCGCAGADAPAQVAQCTIPVAAMRCTPADRCKGDFVVAADGTMRLDGKTVGRIACTEARDAAGAAVIVVKPDGTVVGGPTVPRGKFVGDELVVDAGPKTMRVTVDDAGVLTIAVDGQTLSGTYEGGGRAKRGAIVAWLYHTHLAVKKIGQGEGARGP
jgi:hypothetical protein